jgi:hypothetical protein
MIYFTSLEQTRKKFLVQKIENGGEIQNDFLMADKLKTAGRTNVLNFVPLSVSSQFLKNLNCFEYLYKDSYNFNVFKKLNYTDLAILIPSNIHLIDEK